MSKSKFDAARELIQEKHYDAARAVLQTMDHPTARQWIQKLDEIAPSFPVIDRTEAQEQDRFFRTRNRDRRMRRIGNGIQLLGMAIGSFVLFAIFAYPEFTQNDNTIELGLECLFLPLGLVALIGGLRFMFTD